MKHVIHWILPIVVALFSGSALAEQGCPPGMIPGAAWTPSMATCVPISQDQQQPAPPPSPSGEWIKTWGAIAHDSINGFLGVAVGKMSKGDAEEEARAKCAEAGGAKCKDWVSYQNQCAAVAGPYKNGSPAPGSLQFARGPSPKDVQHNAIAGCSSENSAQCQVLYSACSEPIFHKF